MKGQKKQLLNPHQLWGKVPNNPLVLPLILARSGANTNPSLLTVKEGRSQAEEWIRYVFELVWLSSKDVVASLPFGTVLIYRMLQIPVRLFLLLEKTESRFIPWWGSPAGTNILRSPLCCGGAAASTPAPFIEWISGLLLLLIEAGKDLFIG